MTPILTDKQLIPDHQFGFRPQYGTTEQAHRLVQCTKSTRTLTTNVSALQHLLTLAKPSIRFGIPAYCTSWNRRSRIQCTQSYNPILQIGCTRWDNRRNTLHYTPLVQGYLKGASLAPDYASYSQLLYQSPNKRCHLRGWYGNLGVTLRSQHRNPTPQPNTFNCIWINCGSAETSLRNTILNYYSPTNCRVTLPWGRSQQEGHTELSVTHTVQWHRS
jgi:hypothetical protein